MLLPFHRTLLATSLFLTASALAAPAGNLPLMPWPQQVEVTSPAGKFVLTDALQIQVSGDQLMPEVNRWRERLARQTGWYLLPEAQENAGGQAAVNIIIKQKVAEQPEPDSDESYQLTVTPQGATLTANTRFGAMRGMETLLQLVQNDGENTFIPLVSIHDQPRFAWRGVLLDSARHFLPVPDIKRQLDGMAAAKLNVLHWHLSDDQGWRFESQKYPKLQALASALNDLEARVGAIETQLNSVQDDVDTITEVVDTEEFSVIRDNAKEIVTRFNELGNKGGQRKQRQVPSKSGKFSYL